MNGITNNDCEMLNDVVTEERGGVGGGWSNRQLQFGAEVFDSSSRKA